MNIVNISKAKYRKLEPVIIDNIVLNTEAKILKINSRGVIKVFKDLYRTEGVVFANKLYTLEMLDELREVVPKSFVLPDELCSVNGKIKGFTMPYIDGVNLKVLLNNNKLSLEDKIDYLKKAGNLLEQLRQIRQNNEIDNIYINDLHASNFMIENNTGNLRLLDCDSIKICDNKPFVSKHLTPFGIFNNTPEKYNYFESKGKYYDGGIGYVEANENSDLYCYTIMILNYLYCGNVANMEIDEYYEYISYLKKIGFDKNLIDIFIKMLTKNVDNENPKDLLNTLNYYQVSNASKKVYEKKIGK